MWVDGGPGSRGRRLCDVAVAALSLPALSSCHAQEASHPRHVRSLGCFIGRFRMQAMPALARPSQVIRLAANGPEGPQFIGLDSWGRFGRMQGGRFVALYDIPAVPVQEHVGALRAIRISSSGNVLAGVGMPNRPFLTRVPAVPAGTYLIQFDYNVSGLTLSELKKLGLGSNKSYTLCVRVNVTG